MDSDPAQQLQELEAADTSGMSKGQLKKHKDKIKKLKEEVAAAQAGVKKEDAPKEEAKAEAGGKDKKKGKKLNAAALQAQKAMEEKKALEEEQKRLEELQRQKEEEERLEEEKLAKEREIEKEKKKEEKRKRIEQLKKEGKYKTEADLERERIENERREAYLKSLGINLDDVKGASSDKKGSMVYTKKKKFNKNQNQNNQNNENTQENDNKEEQIKAPTENKEEKKAQEEPQTIAEPKKQDKIGVTEFDSWETAAEVLETKKEETVEEKKPSKEETKAADEKPKPKKGGKDKVVVEDATEKSKVVEEKQAKPASKKDKGKKPADEEFTSELNFKVDEKSQKQRKPQKVIEDDEEGDKKIDSEYTKMEQKGPDDGMRSPICCILGHVDTGKTKLLDKMRNTNVQEGEAGGITQQIGATFFPYDKLVQEVDKVSGFHPTNVDVPGLLVIDTPGHESFSNLRSRGSGLCDIAILVIDLMHGIQKQTLESMELLKFRKTPFVIALNKIDRIYDWKPRYDGPSYLSLKKQKKDPQLEFKDRTKKILTALAEKGFNASLYYENDDPDSYVSVVPTSAISGEGISDLLTVVINLSQRWLKKRIARKDDEFKCTVLENKVIEGHGATIDVMLVNGRLSEGDKIVLAGYNGVITTTVRTLLTPHPMKEMRVKNEYLHHKSIRGAMGIKIAANDLENALAGSELFVCKNDDEVNSYKGILEDEIKKIKKSIKVKDQGVLVAASTLGSLEALLQFLKTSKIPVAAIHIGPISKAEIVKAMQPLQVEEGEILKEYATILAFDVKVLADAQELAEKEGVKIFTANIIYHLFDHFMAYVEEIKEERKRNEGKMAVFPAVLKTVAFFNKKDPIIMGVDVVEGVLKVGTPICAFDKEKLKIGVIDSIEKEHKPLAAARVTDGSVAVRIKGDSSIMAGRHFEQKDKLVSIISRESIDALKKYFRDDMTKTDWDLVRKLKTGFGII